MNARDPEKVRRLVREAVAARGLVSVMNDTKWRSLVEGVGSKLPFAPAFRVKYVLAEAPYPESLDEAPWYGDDWIEGLDPFDSVEWIQVASRLKIAIGQLLPPRVDDRRDDFLALLRDLRIPHRESGPFVHIFGYIHDTASLKVAPHD